jgi:predicted ester cyclase
MQNRREILSSVAAGTIIASGLAATSGIAANRGARVPRSGANGSGMTPDELARFYRRYIQAINSRDLDAVAGMVHEDVFQNGVAHKRTDVLASFRSIADACPDYHWGLQQLVVQDDVIAARLQNTGKPVKEFFGYPATGRSLNFMEFCQYRIRDGRFAEMWFLEDRVTIGKQLRGEQA